MSTQLKATKVQSIWHWSTSHTLHCQVLQLGLPSVEPRKWDCCETRGQSKGSLPRYFLCKGCDVVVQRLWAVLFALCLLCNWIFWTILLLWLSSTFNYDGELNIVYNSITIMTYEHNIVSIIITMMGKLNWSKYFRVSLGGIQAWDWQDSWRWQRWKLILCRF